MSCLISNNDEYCFYNDVFIFINIGWLKIVSHSQVHVDPSPRSHIWKTHV